MNNQTKTNFFASCSRNLEELLEREASTFGCEKTDRQTGGVSFSASYETCLEFLLHSRISSRIFMKVTDFSIKSLNELYGKVKGYSWQNTFPLNQTFKIKTIFDSSAKRSFKNSILFSQKAKDGIVDHFREKTSKRPNFMSIDIYTCKNFEIQDVINFTKNMFQDEITEITWRE